MVLLLCGARGVVAAERGVPPVAGILAHLTARSSLLATYESHVDADFRLHSFPYFREHLDGSAYYKRPERYAIAFRRVPRYMRGFERLSTDISNPADWIRRDCVTYAGQRFFGTRPDIVLKLVARKRGQISEQDVLIDPQSWSIDEMDWHYYNGGVIIMQQRYRDEGAYRVIGEQDAVIAIPYVHAVVHATYGDYHFNAPVDDAVFEMPR